MATERTWISDDKGNRCSVERWGSEAAARKALASLKGCSDCSDCSGCSRCSDCFDCSGCSRCSGCSGKKETDGGVAPAVPVIQNIHQRVFAAASELDAFDMGTWHCGTAHCRGGHVVHLAGEAGRALEAFHDTCLAAMLIYAASSPLRVSPVRFFETNDQALADMKRLAEEEAALAPAAEA